jgi:endopeptidase La
MFSLPFISIPKEILIPHPGNNYTITLNKTDKELFDVKSFQYLEKNVTISYKNAFLITVASDENSFSNILAVCNLINKATTKDSFVYHFISVKKATLLSEKDGFLFFNFLEPLKFNTYQTKSYSSLISFIQMNSYLKHVSDNVNLKNQKKDETLDQIINYLYPNLKEDYNFFVSLNVDEKIKIINSLIINYHSDFKKTQPQPFYPKHILYKIEKESSRLKNLPQSSSEYSNTLDYLDVLKSLPWSSKPQSNLDIAKIEEALSETHLGLQDVKDSVADHFAFQQLTGKTTGSYMLFDGPPGTGKTSIAKAIAKATDRDFIPIALGGISDEAEIRGHRRTYLGSKPGRLLSSMQKIKSNNPIILLDELDKISSSNKGDPYSALLELLDPEQNSGFVDKYLELPYDFSKAFIICTSNDASSIPVPLRDRLSIIKFKNYSTEEKYVILTKYILPNYLESYNLETYDINFSNDLQSLISLKNNLREIKRIVLRLLKYSARLILTGVTSIYLDEVTYYDIYKKEKQIKRIGF